MGYMQGCPISPAGSSIYSLPKGLTMPRKATAPTVTPQPGTREIIDTMAATIAGAWHKDAMRSMATLDFYLWHRPARAGERVAMPIHSVDQPNDEYTRDILISNAWTRDQATRRIAERMSVLPICGGA